MGSRLEKKSAAVSKRINNHVFDNEKGDEYEGSKFGGFSDYFRRKKIKLQNLDAELREHSKDNPQIFRGVVCHVNGYTQPSLNDIHEMIVAHGGGFIQYLDGKTMVTHIIASNLTPKKAVEFKRYRIVKPAWIVDSVSAGRLLPWNEYRVVDEGVTQKVLGFQNGAVVSVANTKQKGYRDQTDTSWYTTQLRKQTDAATSDAQPEAQGSATPPHSTAMATSSFGESDIERLDVVATEAQLLKPLPEFQHAVKQRDDSDQKFDHHPQEPRLVQTPPSSNPKKSPPETSPAAVLAPIDDSSGPSQTHEYESERSSLKRPHLTRDESPRKAAKLTAEEHNTILLADPRIRKSTVVNPDFLEQYYRESRLHHLSTWKADLKSQLRALTEAKSLSQKAKQRRPPGSRRYIMHVDFDSFFVAVSLKKCPQYKDMPCVVAHGGGSGSEIASCNYPARKFGVSNGMWMKRAQELCKDLEVLPYDFPAYEEDSRKFYDAILATGGIVQSVSIDEALIDISALCIAEGGTDGVRHNEGGTYREQMKADEIATQLRAKVLAETGCNVSVGLGGNILLAKVALRKAKPAGQFHLKPEAVLDFLGELEVQSLPGVAHSLGAKLEELSIRYVKDIRQTTKEQLVTKLGPKTGEKLWDYSRGIDRVEVGDVVIRKSVSAEVNWGVRFENQEQVEEFIENLCIELEKRLSKEKVKGRQLTLKIMRRAADAPLDPPKHLGHGKCDTYNKSVQLGVCTNDAKIINKEIIAILRGFGFSPGELRGIGVQMQKLEAIKVEGALESSQRRLQFKLPTPPDMAEDKIRPHEDPKAAAARDEDGIEDVVTPRAQRTSTTMPVKLLANSPSKKSLNVAGTQFVMPTQVDPAVLAELPEDIRAKLTKHFRPVLKPSLCEDVVDSNAEESEADTTADFRPAVVALPNESQLDADTLAALPADVRAEVLASYRTTRARGKAQVVLPQSPRKNRHVPPTSKIAPARKGRGRGGGLFGGTRASTRASAADSTLTQSNFVARLRQAARQDSSEPPSEGEQTTWAGAAAAAATATATEPDPEFLAALPPELRDEVLANHRRERLRRNGGIDLNLHQRPRGAISMAAAGKRSAAAVAAAQMDAAVEQRVFKLPPREPRPTFTKGRLCEVSDLRGMIRSWVAAFADEAPFDEDVGALVKYLREVVVQERDVDKAVRVVRWLEWAVGEAQAGNGMAAAAWAGVLGRVKDGVQAAVRERRLAPVEL